jgi:hypothetical protein
MICGATSGVFYSHSLNRELTSTPNGRSERNLVPYESETAPEEGSYLWHLQRIKNAGIMDWLAFGTSAAEIRDRELYRPQFTRWSEVCKVELHRSASQANREIKGAFIAFELQRAGCSPLPSCERQVRPLGVLEVPVYRIEAWNTACAMKRPGFAPTAIDVQRAVRKFIPPGKVNIENLRKLKKHLARSQKSLRDALDAYAEPDVSEFLQGAAGLKVRRLIAKRLERNRDLLDRFKIEEKILL